MQKIKGKYASATIFTDNIEEYAFAQIKMICDNEVASGSKIRIMPDVHPGKVGPVGLTMTVKDRVMPALVGEDIGCGISYIKFKAGKVEFQKLDRVIREIIPTGFDARREPHHSSRDFDVQDLICAKHINHEKAYLALGTLGGGNHFIELDTDDEGYMYAFVHSGSRRLGKEVFEAYMKKGQKQLEAKGIAVPYEHTYLEGQLLEDYIHDVLLTQGYAMLNREIILTELAKGMKWKPISYGESIHNCIDDKLILRKGAVDAYSGDEVIIPINAKDGIIIGEGKGNDDWNFSAPHGSGRIGNRKTIVSEHTVREYRKCMEGVYSSTISKETLDEAPFAYRGIDEILENIKDTVEVKKILRSVYNYKAGSKEK